MSTELPPGRTARVPGQHLGGAGHSRFMIGGCHGHWRSWDLLADFDIGKDAHAGRVQVLQRNAPDGGGFVRGTNGHRALGDCSAVFLCEPNVDLFVREPLRSLHCGLHAFTIDRRVAEVERKRAALVPLLAEDIHCQRPGHVHVVGSGDRPAAKPEPLRRSVVMRAAFTESVIWVDHLPERPREEPGIKGLDRRERWRCHGLVSSGRRCAGTLHTAADAPTDGLIGWEPGVATGW